MRTMGSCRKGNAGFSLLDLTITVTIAAILSAVALPSYMNYVFETRITGEVANFAVILNQARISAVEFGEPVSVCASNNGTTCNSANWEDGWLVFTDTGALGQVDGSDVVLRQGQPHDDRINLHIDSGGLSYIRFLPNDLLFV